MKRIDKVEGFLEVGVNDSFEVVINHGDLKPDKDGVGHIVFSPNQARALAQSLLLKAHQADEEFWAKWKQKWKQKQTNE